MDTRETWEDKCKTSVFFVEANAFERFCLWEKHSKETCWEDDNAGGWERIGFVDKKKKKPIFVEFWFAKIHGKRICFYSTTSRHNDSQKVEEYIKENYPVKWDNGTRVAMTDAMNFHHAIDACNYYIISDIKSKQ